MGTVGGLGLYYYELQGDAPLDDLGAVMQDDGFVMPFVAHLEEVELRPDAVVLPRLKKVRRLADRKKAPGSREGCKDCEIVGRWWGW